MFLTTKEDFFVIFTKDWHDSSKKNQLYRTVYKLSWNPIRDNASITAILKYGQRSLESEQALHSVLVQQMEPTGERSVEMD